MSSASSSKNAPTSFNDLPQETAANIFLRLPVKSLIRSTLVNKKWYSLITNPTFISSQIKTAISQCHNNNVVLVIPPSIVLQKRCSLISIETSKVVEKYELPFTTRTNSLKLIDSVHGLMLLTDLHVFYASRHLYLWNPCVKSHRALVTSCFNNFFQNIYNSYFISGLGFNKACDDYRVVRVVYVSDNKGNQFGDVAPKVEVYSLRKHTWRKIKDPVVPRMGQADGVYVNGSFYWLENSKPEYQEDGRCCSSGDLWMLSFDFESEVFGELKVPRKVSKCLATAMFELMKFEGSLALCVFDAHHRNGVISHPYRIWLMKQEDGVISWSLRFSATIKEDGWPLDITNRGTFLIETHAVPGPLDIRVILACDLKTMHYKYLGFGMRWAVGDPRLRPESCSIETSFTESLVMYEGGKSLLKFVK